MIMKTRNLIRLAPVVLIFLFQQETSAQGKSGVPIFTADSLASGNYKEVWKSFFQLALDRFTGKQKELTFTSNPFALMLKADPDLAVDTNYTKYKALRNLNFSVTGRLDSSYRFNGFSSGITYAIVNRRDITMYQQFNEQVRNANKEIEALTDGIGAFVSTLPPGSPLSSKLITLSNKLLQDKTYTFDKLDKESDSIIRKVINDNKITNMQQLFKNNNKISINQIARNGYDSVKKNFQNRLLWTLGVSDTTYNDKFMFSNVALTTRILKGLSAHPERASNLELDITGRLNFVDDTLQSGRDLKRSILTSEAGFNWVYKAKKTNQSILELKFTAAYNRIFNGAYKNEKKELFTLNGTFSIRILDEFWLPVQFKYDPKSGNVLGFLSVKFNFTSLKKMVMPGK
jgi:hypothetical protein